MSSTLFESEVASYDESDLMDKKSTIRALTLKRDNYAIEIAEKLGLPLPGQRFWTMKQVDFDDPRISDIKDDFLEVEKKISDYTWEVDRIEAIKNGELPRHEAKVKVYKFLGSLSDEEGNNFLKQHHLGTDTLTEAVLICPTLLDNLMDFEENLEVIRADPKVWW